VNLSARQLAAPSLTAQVGEALDATGLEPERLCLEITETALLDDAEVALVVLDALHGLGVRLSIDDFGTGYSSLLYLKRYPVDFVKIDRVFVSGLGVSAQDDAIVRAVIDLAHAVGVSVVAEGVETEAQASALRAMGCDLGQGFLWSRPVEAAALAPAHERTSR
jgi:EAL domain-containing protein (putative c-di-GMP-specific phosphodiesterase class I)